MQRLLLLAIAVSCCTSAAATEDAKQFFDSLYGNRLKQVKATVDRADDVALATEILTAARAIERADVVALLCDNAIELSQRHADGLATAIDASRLLADKVEPRRAEARKKLVEFLTKQSFSGDTRVKQKAADELIEVLTLQGDEAFKAGRYDEALTGYRQAMTAAQRQKSPFTESIKAKIELVASRSQVQIQLARLRGKVLADATDTASVHEIIRLCVVDLDNPAEAMKVLDRAKDARLIRLVPLAAKGAENASEAECLALGEWYSELSGTATTSSKEAMWRRASSYLMRYLGFQPTDQLARTKAELLLKPIAASLATMEVDRTKLESKQNGPESWISSDAIYKVSSESEFPALSELLSGGQGIHRNDFAFHSGESFPGQYIVIDLGMSKIVSRIWIENRRKRDMLWRAQGLTVSLATNLKQIGKPIWTAEKVETEWTVELTSKVKARYVIIKQAESSKQPLHLAQVKVFGWDAKSPDDDEWISRDATYKVSSQHPEYQPLAALLTGGSGIHVEGDFAFHTQPGAPSSIVIDLGKEKSVNRIWIENRRRYSRANAKGMTVSLSTQPNEKTKPVWIAQNTDAEWMIDLAQTTKARYITIRQADKNVDGFHLAQVRVYGKEK